MGAALLMLPKILAAASTAAGLVQTNVAANRQKSAMAAQKKDAEKLARQSDVINPDKPDIDLSVDKKAPVASLRKTGLSTGGLGGPSAAKIGGL